MSDQAYTVLFFLEAFDPYLCHKHNTYKHFSAQEKGHRAAKEGETTLSLSRALKRLSVLEFTIKERPFRDTINRFL